jgi:hypothetical protein
MSAASCLLVAIVATLAHGSSASIRALQGGKEENEQGTLFTMAECPGMSLQTTQSVTFSLYKTSAFSQYVIFFQQVDAFQLRLHQMVSRVRFTLMIVPPPIPSFGISIILAAERTAFSKSETLTRQICVLKIRFPVALATKKLVWFRAIVIKPLGSAMAAFTRQVRKPTACTMLDAGWMKAKFPSWQRLVSSQRPAPKIFPWGLVNAWNGISTVSVATYCTMNGLLMRSSSSVIRVCLNENSIYTTQNNAERTHTSLPHTHKSKSTAGGAHLTCKFIILYSNFLSSK